MDEGPTTSTTGEPAHPVAKSLLSVQGQAQETAAVGEQKTDEQQQQQQQEKKMTNDPTSGETHGHDKKVGANDETPTPNQTEQCNTGKAGVTKLIVPPGHDVPIKQTMTNIFEQCKQAKSEGSLAAAPCKGSKPALEVKANIWMSQQELKKTKERGQCASEAKADQSTPEDIPPAPAFWGTTPCISPDVQEPPKRRGRKPNKDKQTVVDKDETKQEKPSRKRAASKAKATAPNAEPVESSTKEPASSSTPSRRMKLYLQEPEEEATECPGRQ